MSTPISRVFPILRVGDSGNMVDLMVNKLRDHGFLPKLREMPSLDRPYTADLSVTVEQFQLARGLEPDGLVGPATWAALLADKPPHLPGDVAAALDLINLRFPVDQRGADNWQGATYRTLAAALNYVGAVEEPSGSNNGPRIKALVHSPMPGHSEQTYYDYIGYKPPAGALYPPWCALAVSNWLAFGLPATSWAEHPFGGWFGGVAQIEDWATRNNLREKAPSVGRIFTMGRRQSSSDAATHTRAGHTGLIVAQLDGNRVLTVEGNVNNAVEIRVRASHSMHMIINWVEAPHLRDRWELAHDHKAWQRASGASS